MNKNGKINKILTRPTHSRQEISNQDKNKLKELEGNNPELLMPQQNNELYSFNNNNNSNNSENEVLENQDNSVLPNDADLNGANIDEDDDELLYDGCFPQVSSEENVISDNSAEY